MDKYVTITKVKSNSGTKKRKLNAHEHIMKVATEVNPRKAIDIWQSASTGHQVSDSGAKSVSYNAARCAKLRAQFPCKSALESLQEGKRDSNGIELFDYHPDTNKWHPAPVPIPSLINKTQGIFQGCVMYLDGYLGPKMSDYALKRAITMNGGLLGQSLQKTRITHVVLSSRGDLAASKVRREREGRRNRCCYVTVDWVHACLDAGKRVSECHYSVAALAPCQSVASTSTSTCTSTSYAGLAPT